MNRWAVYGSPGTTKVIMRIIIIAITLLIPALVHAPDLPQQDFDEHYYIALTTIVPWQIPGFEDSHPLCFPHEALSKDCKQ